MSSLKRKAFTEIEWSAPCVHTISDVQYWVRTSSAQRLARKKFVQRLKIYIEMSPFFGKIHRTPEWLFSLIEGTTVEMQTGVFLNFNSTRSEEYVENTKESVNSILAKNAYGKNDLVFDRLEKKVFKFGYTEGAQDIEKDLAFKALLGAGATRVIVCPQAVLSFEEAMKIEIAKKKEKQLQTPQTPLEKLRKEVDAAICLNCSDGNCHACLTFILCQEEFNKGTQIKLK